MKDKFLGMSAGYMSLEVPGRIERFLATEFASFSVTKKSSISFVAVFQSIHLLQHFLERECTTRDKI